MKPSILLAGLLAASANTQARDSKPADIIVYVTGDGAPSGPVDYGARGTATSILARAGVNVLWRDGEPKGGSGPGSAVVIRVRFSGKIPEQASREAAAYALPFGGEGTAITVMYERIFAVAGRASRARAILAHVLAHEIGHVLQRTNQHAAKGVMKAHWTGRDYDAMERKPLTFTLEDVELIRLGLAGRLGSRE
ncbi:MAG: hypothetical protein JST11_20435 [Acidobacteria bacterium]|nr:hypothetical protein [Acidobacteriota bacterium]